MNIKKHLGLCVAKGYSSEYIVNYFRAMGLSYKKSDIDKMIKYSKFDDMNHGVDFTNHEYSEVRVAYNNYLNAKELLKKALKSKFIPYMNWRK